MGAHASCCVGLVAQQKVAAKRRATRKCARLSDDYSLGRELGRGSFGIVRSCTSKATSREYAVKRVCKRESGLESINHEVGMLRKLAHPSVVELHGVYPSKGFVDMVFSIYRGGDMVEATQIHWNSKGGIPMAAVQNLSRQMFQSVEWLHQNSIVHRDVKGDNFLLDRADVEHPDCRVCLSDFGFAVALSPDERLEEVVGSKQYMAPEIQARSYGFKVDVWAAGVTTYVLVASRFPFQNEAQACTQMVEIPPRCGGVAGSFLLGTINQREAERLSASVALAHPFLADARTAEVSPGPPVTQVGHNRDVGMHALAKLASCKSESATAMPSGSTCCDEHNDISETSP